MALIADDARIESAAPDAAGSYGVYHALALSTVLAEIAWGAQQSVLTSEDWKPTYVRPEQLCMTLEPPTDELRAASELIGDMEPV
jgi:hypothetical protein